LWSQKDFGLLHYAFQEQASVHIKVCADQKQFLVALDAALMKVGGGHKTVSTIINDSHSAY
jgi:hypothetical protein